MTETTSCGECVYWRTPKCNLAADQAILRKGDSACSEFYPKPGSDRKKQKRLYKDSGATVAGSFEAIYHNEEPAFLAWNGKIFSILESIDINEQTFHPKEGRQVPYEPYGYFEAEVPNREELFWKVRSEFQTFIDIESIWKEALSAFVLLSYQQEKLQTVPYVFLYGDNESGKSTVLQLLKFLCYRPLYGVTIPAADIYGYLEDSDSIGVVLEDEVQGINKDVDKIKIYKAGYKKGAIVPRTIITQNDRIIKYYNVFCLKACASEQIPQVKGFRERFLEIPMVEGYPEKEWSDITKEDLKRLQDLRNMLLKWRMLSRDWELPDVKLNMKGRLKELWKPILQVTGSLTVYDTLFNFVEEQRKERLGIKQDTLEGKIVKVVTDLFNEAKNNSSNIPFQDIWHGLQEELDGKIDEKKPNVMDTSEFFQVTKNRVGYRLREILSGKTKVIKEKGPYGSWVSIKAYEFDVDKLRRIFKKYGYEFSTKLPSLPSSEGAQASESMEKTVENNVENSPHAPQELSNSVETVESQNELPEPSISSKNSEEKSVTEIGSQTQLQGFTLNDVRELTRLTSDYGIEECCWCGKRLKAEWQVTFHNDSWGFLCGSCGLEVSERLACGD